MELTLDDNLIHDQVAEAVKDFDLVPKESLRGLTWNINEFRKRCCGGKSANWVRTFIFDQFPEVLYENGGWVIGAHKTEGIKATIIFAYEACQWMEEHKRDIDWTSKIAC
ncbi:DUF771 domain-containing protein [Limosilactobacillus caecicola]|uniref:DUF771 domain-containing protein n=1 Tax=Limosilactobacillus caecicola TaxID=2941332 RepID=UPI00203BA09D|nr:DUF771 domain-containing protein [Limosilactobacillus caecicola]